MLLEVKNLKTEFKLKKGIVKAVDDVSFQIDKGEILAIVGESGSGKSVTSLSIMGLLQKPGRIAGGQILYKSQDLTKLSRQELQKIRGNQISMIFQEPMTSLNPVWRIKNQIMESIQTHLKLSSREALERTVAMLDTVGIPSAAQRANDYPHQMSGGMRQRVMIAMALACEPELLIADEPTTALDVTIQAQILELLYRMREKFGMAVLLITHDLGVVAEAADRVIVMYCGKIVEEADVRSLFTRPMHPYTVGLLNSIPRINDDSEKRLYMIKGMVPNPLHMPKGCPFADRCDRRLKRCSQEMPELKEINGHKVRCFLYEDAQQAVRAEEVQTS
ncbi:MAG: ABC transporter ATP-binding protein [Desulfitobacteriia bacterium]